MTRQGPFLPAFSAVVLAALVAAAGVTLPAHAQAQAPKGMALANEQGPSWASLTPAQRSALAPLQAEWPRIDASQKQKWVEVATKLPGMGADERSRVQVRMAEWARMTPSERGRARLQFQETRRLAPSDRQERWQAYQSLPPDQRRALAANAAPSAAPKATKPAPNQTSSSGLVAKKNTVPFLPPVMAPKPVGPTVVQSRPGATTSLVTRQGQPPAHQQAGMPKIAASKGFVDQATLLPKRGPQGAAVAAAPASEKPASTRQ